MVAPWGVGCGIWNYAPDSKTQKVFETLIKLTPSLQPLLGDLTCPEGLRSKAFIRVSRAHDGRIFVWTYPTPRDRHRRRVHPKPKIQRRLPVLPTPSLLRMLQGRTKSNRIHVAHDLLRRWHVAKLEWTLGLLSFMEGFFTFQKNTLGRHFDLLNTKTTHRHLNNTFGQIQTWRVPAALHFAMPEAMLAMAKGNGPRPQPEAMSNGLGQRPWPKATAIGHG